MVGPLQTIITLFFVCNCVSVSLTHITQKDTKLKGAYDSVFLPVDTLQFHIVCRKQNRADIYEAEVGRPLLGNPMLSAAGHHDPLSSLSFPLTHTHTPLLNDKSKRHSNTMTFKRQ
ncbi:hypothetical protein XENOCAPTIV_001457 [Xenoophorus captivus]|uniref:Uncharacterized protein n=1 Tax=Xenoophorus captivus TaxID=1517983 RepID=A0ABV0REU7_9TELE